MSLNATGSKLRDRFLTVLQDAVVGLKPGDDPELTLEALIEASEVLTERLKQELQELREEQTD
jgi:hypothetical protein